MSDPKILMWDIEATSLNASFGTILCIGWKWLGQKKVYVPTIIDHSKRGMLDDKGLVKEFVTAFNEADMHVTWYGERYDLPMINSKVIKYKMKPLPAKPHLDLWKTARKHFKLHSNRLQVWSEYLDVADRKTPVDFDSWLKAALGDKKSLNYVVEHCKKDVLVLEEVFERMRPWIKEEPARQLFVGGDAHCCPSCGSKKMHRRGYQVARTRRYARYQCQSCGKWSRSKACDKNVTAGDLVGGY